MLLNSRMQHYSLYGILNVKQCSPLQKRHCAVELMCKPAMAICSLFLNIHSKDCYSAKQTLRNPRQMVTVFTFFTSTFLVGGCRGRTQHRYHYWQLWLWGNHLITYTIDSCVFPCQITRLLPTHVQAVLPVPKCIINTVLSKESPFQTIPSRGLSLFPAFSRYTFPSDACSQRAGLQLKNVANFHKTLNNVREFFTFVLALLLISG